MDANVAQPKKKRGRPVEGEVKWGRKGTRRWWGRVTYPDGARRWVPLDPAIPADDETHARAMCIDAHGIARGLPSAPGRVETLATYAERWCAWREERGLASVKDDCARLSNHALPRLGHRDVRRITRAELEDLIEDLDRRVRARELGWKTADLVAGIVGRLFADAQGAKRRDLRVRADNPAAGLARPERGPRKAKQYLYPSEFEALVRSPLVPGRWKRLFAIAVYTGHVLESSKPCAGRTLTSSTARCTCTRASTACASAACASSTKSRAARRVPLERELAPLLQALLAEGKNPEGSVLAMPSPGVLSRKLKVYLGKAGVMRTELFTNTETRKAITFHDLRATWVTWCAVRGDDPLKS